ncbi:MAG: MAPEG family protein [Marinagarivorans sp.]
MKEPLILMLCLMALMFVVAFVCRLWSVFFSGITLAHYELFNLDTEPAYVTRTTNNLNNQFQLPLVFIAACILSFNLKHESEALIFNAWGFVTSRALHSLVHIMFNRVLVRSAIFGAGLFFLIRIWFELLAKI